MGAITDFLGKDHRHCDEVFAALEQHVDANQWEAANAAMTTFSTAMTAHFAMEEQALFPAFEQATGSSSGPTAVMRGEHVQIRSILEQLGNALKRRDAAEFLGEAETLNIMLQQHNMKEEGILYPMTDRVLADDQHAILDAMINIGAPA